MDSYDKLPDAELKPVGDLSKTFLALGIKTFRGACDYVHNIDYGYNSNYEDKMIFFKELKENLDSILSFVKNALPNGNNNINSIYIKTTMGKSVKVEDTGKGRR